MEIYLVGGAVRDTLLQRPVKERDWVVVGGTAEQLLAQGFKQVGKDFPVFLHPKTQEEYALARLERKAGVGYKGFLCDASASVTLEEDLMRRDLTVNAMAQTEEGQIIDPYGGQRDLQLKRLRHVSPAFVEDPLRVLRVARFAARYHNLGFQVAPDTMNLMKSMVNKGEVTHLTPERIWQEVHRGLMTENPSVFFAVLHQCNALSVIFPELARLFGQPAAVAWHPEIDTGVHTLMAVDQAAQLGGDLAVRFATLCHDLGKGLTAKSDLPKHHGHEHRGIPPVDSVAQRWRVPNEVKALSILVTRYHDEIHRLSELTTKALLKILASTDSFRRPERFTRLLLACEADARGRLGHEHTPYPQRGYWLEALAVASAVSTQPFIEAGLQGRAIAEALRKEQLRVLQQLQYKWKFRQ
ncbi:MAG: multifunctional CCA addition/repair protein [Gammaproteobacteria bacterium]